MVDLRDSSMYQLIIEEGMAKGLQQGIKQGLEQGRERGLEQGREQGLVQGRAVGVRTMLFDIGARRLGSATAAVQESLSAIDDVERLRRMGVRVLDAASWQDLLDTP